MRHLRLFENFNDIESICKKYGIQNYTINEDGSIDVDGRVNLVGKKLTKIPLKFRNVSGDFFCNENKLVTLEGCPQLVGGGFDCYNNQLTSLEGCPKEVGGDFYCNFNQLVTLEGGPQFVGGDFNCSDNQLVTLNVYPICVDGDFYCRQNPIDNIYKLFKTYNLFKNSMDYGYLRGTNIIKNRFQEALDELGIELPDEIEGYKYI